MTEPSLIDVPMPWDSELAGIIEFTSNDVQPIHSIRVMFCSNDDRVAFLRLLGESTDRLKSIWFPHKEYLKQSTAMNCVACVDCGRFPIYIISKGRWETRLTSKALEKLGITYHIVVEPQEADLYRSVIDHQKVLVLPFSNLGQGSIPARNWVWEHAIARGAERHWILDDNIDGFYRLHNNLKTRIIDFNPFIPIEEFTLRHSNIAIAGMNYEFFVTRRAKQPPYVLNTRIYSCILIKNNIPYRWRGRYNEDTDISLRALKDGYATVLFNAITAKKMPTMKLAGGNTDELYKDDGRLKMAQSLQEQHPDVTKITRKWGRWQHHVDYRRFKNNPLDPPLGGA